MSQKRLSERSEWVSKQMSSASERVSGQASGPVLQSGFLVILAHSAVPAKYSRSTWRSLMRTWFYYVVIVFFKLFSSSFIHLLCPTPYGHSSFSFSAYCSTRRACNQLQGILDSRHLDVDVYEELFTTVAASQRVRELFGRGNLLIFPVKQKSPKFLESSSSSALHLLLVLRRNCR